MIPDDVTIQVLTQARPDVYKRQVYERKVYVFRRKS